LLTYCPQANSIERAFGNLHDKMPTQPYAEGAALADLGRQTTSGENRTWKHNLPSIYYEPEVEAELTKLPIADRLKRAV